jgi:uncharacterized protein (DUF1501 family)
MSPTRRDILRMGLANSALLACGATVPTFLARSASVLAAQPKRPGGSRVLVVLQLDGGNDGLNTVVPHSNDAYRRHRPQLHIRAAGLHRLNDNLSLHPSLQGMMRLHESQKLAIIQSVGYPNPSRSHFQSMAIWHTARLNAIPNSPGWLARCIDQRFAGDAGDAPAIHVESAVLPQSLSGGTRQVPSLPSLEQFRRRLGLPEGGSAREQRADLDQMRGHQHGTPDSLLQFVERSSVITYRSSDRLESVMRGRAGTARYPENFGLARRLKLIAQLVKADLQTAIYYTQLGGFDTHASQLATHGNLLLEVGNSLKAFLDDLNEAGLGQRVLVLVFSEFGRRVAENASGGTDHGTAAPVFLLGHRVRAGIHGPNPNLDDLHDGDPRHAIDFRRLYSTVLDRWLGCASATVLGERFENLDVLQGEPR